RNRDCHGELLRLWQLRRELRVEDFPDLVCAVGVFLVADLQRDAVDEVVPEQGLERSREVHAALRVRRWCFERDGRSGRPGHGTEWDGNACHASLDRERLQSGEQRQLRVWSGHVAVWLRVDALL